MKLPNDVENALFTYFLEIIKYYRTVSEIDLRAINLNEVDIYEEDAQISILSLQNWLRA